MPTQTNQESISVVVRDRDTLSLLRAWRAWIVKATGDTNVGAIVAELPALSVSDGGPCDLALVDNALAELGYRRAADWFVTPLGFVAWVDFDAQLGLKAMKKSSSKSKRGEMRRTTGVRFK